jgi:hypothetical protein
MFGWIRDCPSWIASRPNGRYHQPSSRLNAAARTTAAATRAASFRYWPFQGIEFAIFAALAVALLGTAVWSVLGRRPSRLRRDGVAHPREAALTASG